MVDRRRFLKSSVAAGVAAGLPMGWVIKEAGAVEACTALEDVGEGPCSFIGLSDPEKQFEAIGFTNPVPDALSPGFIYQPNLAGEYTVRVQKAKQLTGLVDSKGKALKTWVWGYGDPSDGLYTWPGRTFQVKNVDSGGPPETIVNWQNGLSPKSMKGITGGEHLLPVDESLHWCYSLHGYTQHSIANDGVPIITHLHGGHSDFEFDGNPEFFYNYNEKVVGPSWAREGVPFTTRFRYDNDVRSGNLWYHDHALGITRLNVYAGLAGFYFVRDNDDTGEAGNPLGLPAWPYEKAYAIQDRMFSDAGELFIPVYPGEPYYAGFIEGEAIGGELPESVFPDGGPTAMAEFFGDHMIVNGVAWPVENVEPRNYRLHVLNGTDSRFMALEFYEVPAGAKDISSAIKKLNVDVIGSDQGLASGITNTDRLVSEPGSRYDVVVDFKQVSAGNRVIMWNRGGDTPFGGGFDDWIFERTDRIMAFDVISPFDGTVADATPAGINFGPSTIPPGTAVRTRKVALFEGKDEFGRLQPLLGTVEPGTDYLGNPVNWPNTAQYTGALLPAQDGSGTGTAYPLVGQMEGSIAWHSPTTENPALNSWEEWEVWNMTGDAHPVHLHLVHFEILDRQEIVFDSNADEDGFIPDGAVPADDGVYKVMQPTVQHNSVPGDASTYGIGFKTVKPSNPSDAYGPGVPQPGGYIENAPKDMAIALPGQITRIRAYFDKPGRYVWHCHILSHEDHEMMRVLHVGPGS